MFPSDWRSTGETIGENANMKNASLRPPQAPIPACNTCVRALLFYMRLGMRKGSVVCVALYLSCAASLWAQAFQNLDFESANISDLPPNQTEFVSVTNGLPGWSAYIGTNQLTQVGHNVITLGGANVGVLGPEYYTLQFTQALQGSYSAIIQAGGFDNQGLAASIAQTGLFPSSAKSIQFIGTLQFSQPIFTNSLFVTI